MKKLVLFAWLTTSLLVGLAFIAWGSSYNWHVSSLTAYSIFPLFGLLAFNIMLSHYIVGAVTALRGSSSPSLTTYFRLTSYIVLACILIHPAIFEWLLFRDDFGIPPFSYFHYYSSSLLFFLLLGNIALPLFLAYEFKRKFANRSWWWWVERASDIAMLLVFFHALKLGDQLQPSWYRVLWYIYGMILGTCIVYGVQSRAKRSTPTSA